jgi:hypothetical protein
LCLLRPGSNAASNFRPIGSATMPSLSQKPWQRQDWICRSIVTRQGVGTSERGPQADPVKSDWLRERYSVVVARLKGAPHGSAATVCRARPRSGGVTRARSVYGKACAVSGPWGDLRGRSYYDAVSGKVPHLVWKGREQDERGTTPTRLMCPVLHGALHRH